MAITSGYITGTFDPSTGTTTTSTFMPGTGTMWIPPSHVGTATTYSDYTSLTMELVALRASHKTLQAQVLQLTELVEALISVGAIKAA